MTDSEFMREVTREVRKAYLFFGEEAFAMRQALDRLRAVHDDPAGINHDTLTAPDAGTVIDACETLPLMAEKRLVLVADAKRLWVAEESARLSDYLGHMPETATLALCCGEVDKRTALYKAFARLGGVVECAPRSELQAAEFVIEQATARGCECARPVALLLVEMAGSSLTALTSELDKLCDYAPSTPLSEKTLRLCVTPRLEYRIFDMLDAFLQGRMDRAMAQLGRMLTDTHPLQIIAFMGGRLRLLSIGLRALEAGKREQDAVAAMGGSEYAARKLLSARKRMPRKRCEDAIIRLADLDYAIKSGKTDDQTGLQRVLMEIFL